MDNLDCPKCNGRLGSTKLDVFEIQKEKNLEGADMEFELEVFQCFVCGGVWFDKGKLETYLRENLKTLHSPSLGKQMDQQLNSKKGKCPICKIEMTQHPEAIDQGVMVDTCPKCGGVWLDSTEIDRLEEDEGKLQKEPILGKLMDSIFRARNKDTGPSSKDNVDL